MYEIRCQVQKPSTFSRSDWLQVLFVQKSLFHLISGCFEMFFIQFEM